jgi:katanin p60 ATPase-containing subunit A1
MALQMTGSAREVVLPNSTPEMQPDVIALQTEMESRAASGLPPVRLVTLVNPGNPTGVMIPRRTLEAVAALCAQHGAWMLVDNTYEHFEYEGATPHACVEGPHILNLFSFSKAFGMMGWRVGYLAFPPSLKPELFKVQDTLVICPAVASQRVALGAVAAGRGWVSSRVAALAEQKALVREALIPLGLGAVRGGSGAIYLMARLPVADDVAVVRWLCEAHKVALIPGSACGQPGHVRVCYANLTLEKTREAAARLRAGMEQLVADPQVVANRV